MLLVARSIGRPAHLLLQRRAFAAHVLAVFERACGLLTPDGEVVALVTPAAGDGPLNVVLERSAVVRPGPSFPSGFLDEALGLAPGLPAAVDGSHLRVGRLQVGLGTAVVWEPRPNWEALRSCREAISGRLPLTRTPLGAGRGPAKGAGAALASILASAFRDALGSLRAGWAGDAERLREAAAGLSGLGGGLTPSGDDFLAGVMIGAWLAHPSPDAFCRVLVEAAAPRTTVLSAAFLRAAARGECSAAWQRLLAALAEGEGVAEAAQSVLAQGASSGADTLAGFLWAAAPVTG